MNINNLKQINTLMEKSVKARHYEVAANLRDARNKLYKILVVEHGEEALREAFKGKP